MAFHGRHDTSRWWREHNDDPTACAVQAVRAQHVARLEVGAPTACDADRRPTRRGDAEFAARARRAISRLRDVSARRQKACHPKNRGVGGRPMARAAYAVSRLKRVAGSRRARHTHLATGASVDPAPCGHPPRQRVRAASGSTPRRAGGLTGRPLAKVAAARKEMPRVVERVDAPGRTGGRVWVRDVVGGAFTRSPAEARTCARSGA